MAKVPWLKFGFSAKKDSAAAVSDVGFSVSSESDDATSEEVLKLFGWSNSGEDD